jgi:hypothetical protein
MTDSVVTFESSDVSAADAGPVAAPIDSTLPTSAPIASEAIRERFFECSMLDTRLV